MLRIALRTSRGLWGSSGAWSFTKMHGVSVANGRKRHMSTTASSTDALTQSTTPEDIKFAEHQESQPNIAKEEVASKGAKFYANVICNAAEDERYLDVFKYCAEMKHAGILPSRPVMNAAIHSLAATRQIDAAFVLFDQMLQMKMQPNNVTLHGLLKACEIYSDADRAIEIVHKMRDFGVYPELMEMFILISTFARAGEFDRAFAEYEAFKGLFNVIPTDFLQLFWQIILRSNDPHALIRLLSEFTNANLSIKPEDVHSALETFMRERCLLGCTKIIEQYGTNLSEGSLIKIIAAAGRGKDHEIALHAFRVLCENTSNNPSKYAYNALLYSAITSDNITAFLDVVNVMSLSGHKLSDIFANLFTRICRTPQAMDTAHAHISVLQQSGQVTVDALNAVMRACARAGDMKRAIAVFTDCVQNYQLAPDVGSFNAILCACERVRDLNSALGVLQQMADAGVQPNISTYQSIIDLCVAVSDLERASATLAEMVQAQIQPTYQIYSSLVTLCLNMGEAEQAKAILDAMNAATLTPDLTLVTNFSTRRLKDQIREAKKSI